MSAGTGGGVILAAADVCALTDAATNDVNNTIEQSCIAIKNFVLISTAVIPFSEKLKLTAASIAAHV